MYVRYKQFIAHFTIVGMATKSQIRKMLAARLKLLDHETLKQESVKVVGNVIRQNFATASQHPSIFLSMPSGEIDTAPLVEILLQEKEKVYIPKVIGPHAGDMIMIPIDSMDTIHNFPKSKWGIPEPPLPEGDISIESFGDIDFVFLPGVAFDTHCRRLGHGKGYYGWFYFRFRYKYE